MAIRPEHCPKGLGMDSNHDLLQQLETLKQEIARLEALAAEQAQALERQEEAALSRRLESVGRLAGGVAHHLNNALTAVLGYAGLAQMEAAPESDLYAGLQNIQAAAQQASRITHQLMAFARRTIL